MGEFVTSKWIVLGAWLAAAMIILMNVALIVQAFT
jgi:Mn2+/Fe2+ NRAMP family transporter